LVEELSEQNQRAYAEVERLRKENAQLSQDLTDIRRSAKATFGRWQKANAVIQRVLDLHVCETNDVGLLSYSEWCASDSEDWPCPTILAIEGNAND
jgi:uncharacterized protein (UPF0335 family)